MLACNDGDGPTAPGRAFVVATIEVSPASASALEGETVPFRAVAKNAQGDEIPASALLWRSADPLIAQVDRSGVAVALPRHGTTQIIAEVGGKQAFGTLTSRARCASPAPVEGTREPALPLVIVQFRGGVNAQRMARDLAQKYGFEIHQIYEASFGFSAPLTYAQIAQIRCEPAIEVIGFDGFLELA